MLPRTLSYERRRAVLPQSRAWTRPRRRAHDTLPRADELALRGPPLLNVLLFHHHSLSFSWRARTLRRARRREVEEGLHAAERTVLVSV